MSKAITLLKGLSTSGLILGAALLIADCMECRSTSRTSVVAVCAIVMAFMIGLQFRYLLGAFSRNIGFAEKRDVSGRDKRKLEREVTVSKLMVPNVAINVSILALAGIWAIGAVSSLYSPLIPLMFFVVGIASVLLFGAVTEWSARVYAALGSFENGASRWRWIALSAGVATLIVFAVVVYGLDTLREYPLVGLLCGALGLVITYFGVYRSGLIEDKLRQEPAKGNQ